MCWSIGSIAIPSRSEGTGSKEMARLRPHGDANSRQKHTVIPAKAGIQYSSAERFLPLWCNVEPHRVLDSRLRGNDSVGGDRIVKQHVLGRRPESPNLCPSPRNLSPYFPPA